MKSLRSFFWLLLLSSQNLFSIGITDLITETQFNAMFPNRNAYATNAEFTTNPANRALFSYANLINAATAFPLFCSEGDINVKKRELAAFLANTSHETTGGWGGYVPGAPDYVGRYTWGYCFPREFEYNPTMGGYYCDSGSAAYPPVAGQSYYGRGPIQMSWNYNYGAFSEDVLGDKNILLSNPEKVLEDGTIFYQSAIWFWMTPQTGGYGLIYLKPSCHDVMVNAWTPTDPQKINNKLTSGFPVTINVINGGLESGSSRTNQTSPDDRLGFYLRYCEILGVDAIDPAWGYSGSYSFSTWDSNSDIHKQLNSYYPDNFTLQTRSQGSSAITGYVKDATGKGVARCHIALMNGSTYYEQAITDNTGKYVIDKIPNATYNIVASKTGFTFSPANQTLLVTASNTATDIIATDPNLITMSGTITNGSNQPIKDVVVTLQGTTNFSVATDASGNYTLNPTAGSYTLIFTKSNYSFTSNNTSVTLAATNSVTRNSTGTYSGVYYKISGNVKAADGTTNLLGASVALSGAAVSTTTTDANGNYSFNSLEQGLDYTVTPAYTGLTFTSSPVSNLSVNAVLNFIAQQPIAVSGKILLNGSAMTGVTMRVSNSDASIVSDANGNYSTPVIVAGKACMVTPKKDGYFFEPSYKYYSTVPSAQTQDFVAKVVSGTPKKRIIYYYPEWATYTRNFQVKDIDTRYLTNILYSFVMPFYVDGTKKVDDNIPFRSSLNASVLTVENITVNGVAKSVGLAIVDPFADIQKFPTGGIDVETGTGTGGTYVSTCAEWFAAQYKIKGGLGQLVQLRKKVKNETGRDIQIQISIGGWTLAQAFPLIADNQIASDAFGRTCKSFLDQSTYDGVDVDWEFPVAGGTDGTETVDGAAIPVQPHTANDPINFTRLMKSIRVAIGPNKLLTMASSQNPANVLEKYVFPGTMTKFGVVDNCLDYLDYMQTMSYDYGGYWSSVATHECPLYNSKDSKDEDKNMSASMLIDTLLSKSGGNVPANKIVMGLPFYGKIWAGIEDGGTHGLYQTNPNQPRMPGSWDSGTTPASEASTSIDFGDLKDGKAITKHQYLNVPSAGYTEYWDDVVKCPYMYNPTSKVFISYDDDNSLSEKVKFLNSRYLLGGMVWEATQDAADATLMKAVYSYIQQGKLKIEGVVIGSTGAGISGVTVSLSGGSSATVTTGMDGKFLFAGLEPGINYTISYSKSGVVFAPSSNSYTSMPDSKVLEILGSTSAYSISGKLTLNDGLTLLPNASVEVYKGTTLLQTITSTDGNYQISNLPGGFDYTLKGKMAGYTCTTGEVVITALAGAQTKNLKFQMNQYKLYGTIVNGSGTGISGVTLTLSGSVSQTITTNSTGYFETSLLDGIGTYTLTPSRTFTVFTPTSYSFTNLSKNETFNFSMAEETMLYGYVKDGNTPLANVLVRITVPWIGNGSSSWNNWTYQGQRTDANGYYEFRNGPSNIPTLDVACNNEWDKLPYTLVTLGQTSWTNFSGVQRLDWNTNSALSYILSYTTPGAFTRGTTITALSPTVTGGVVSYSVSPALPAGLDFNTTTGVISGTPTTVKAKANYVVTATNANGSTTYPVSITVNDAPAPTNLTYATPVVYSVGTTIASLTPSVISMVDSYSVSPALPTGLSLNTTTGVISGTSTAIAATAT